MLPFIGIGLIAAGVLALAYGTKDKPKGSDNVEDTSKDGPSSNRDNRSGQSNSDDQEADRGSGLTAVKRKGNSNVRMVDKKLAGGDRDSSGNDHAGELNAATGDHQDETLNADDEMELNNAMDDTTSGDDGGNDNGGDVPVKSGGRKERDSKKADQGDAG